MDSGMSDSAVIEFRDEPTVPLQIRVLPTGFEKTPLIIDNGSWHLRAGWASQDKPAFSFYSLLAKQKGRKGDKEPILIGNDLGNIEALRWMIRSSFDGNVVVQTDYQEVILDYAFANLGLMNQTSLEMPLVMTEPLLNPAYCRKQMNELLFECYAFPYVAYGIDGMFSFYRNFLCTGDPQTDGLIVSVGNVCTHIIPVLGGKMEICHCRRIDLGGLNMTLYLQRLLQLKYPIHATNITIMRMEEIIQGYCYFAENYSEELSRWRNKDFQRKNILSFQLPFQASTGPVPTQEELDTRREENAQRLREMNRRRHLEKLDQDESRLQKLAALQEHIARSGAKNSKDEMKALAVKSTESLQAEVDALSALIQRTKERLERKAMAVPIEEATTEPADPETIQNWVVDLKEKRQRIVEQRAVRKQRKADLGKRRSYASQQRMRVLTQLASGRTGKKMKKDDTFGMQDEDWLVYREINKEAGDSESEDERIQLDEIEGLLIKHDSVFRQEYEKTQALSSGAPPKSPEYYRLEIGVERFRVPEIVFQPSLVGIDQMGILDTIEYLLAEYPADVQRRLASNVFITGGAASLPGMDRRLKKELSSCLPFETSFNVSEAGDPVKDAWSGAAFWAREAPIATSYLSKKEYLECGPGFLKEHQCSNIYRVPPARPVNKEAAKEKQESVVKAK